MIPDSDGGCQQISDVIHFSDVAGRSEDKCGELIRRALDRFYSPFFEPLLLPQAMKSLSLHIAHYAIAVGFNG